MKLGGLAKFDALNPAVCSEWQSDDQKAKISIIAILKNLSVFCSDDIRSMVLVPRITRMVSVFCLDENFVSYGQNHSSRRKYLATGDFGLFDWLLGVQITPNLIYDLNFMPRTWWYAFCNAKSDQMREITKIAILVFFFFNFFDQFLHTMIAWGL